MKGYENYFSRSRNSLEAIWLERESTVACNWDIKNHTFQQAWERASELPSERSGVPESEARSVEQPNEWATQANKWKDKRVIQFFLSRILAVSNHLGAEVPLWRKENPSKWPIGLSANWVKFLRQHIAKSIEIKTPWAWFEECPCPSFTAFSNFKVQDPKAIERSAIIFNLKERNLNSS